jgi:hypothetical protein
MSTKKVINNVLFFLGNLLAGLCAIKSKLYMFKA